MESRFNIPAPAVVKLGSDVSVEMGRRLKVAVCSKSKDVEASAETDPLKQEPRKTSACFHGCPYRNPTQVGGHNFAKARE
jgi:hypothetical protein